MGKKHTLHSINVKGDIIGKQTTKHKQLRLDSLTGVNPKRTHGLGLWGNPRVVMGIRVDEKLKKRFTEVAKLVFGSTCNPIESFMATCVGLYEQSATSGVNLGNTIEVGQIVIQRNLRERRRMVIETETETMEAVAKCYFVNCNRAATERGFYKPEGEEEREVGLCNRHFKLLVDSRNIAWRFY